MGKKNKRLSLYSMDSLLISHARGLIKKHLFISYCWRDVIPTALYEEVPVYIPFTI
jgi:hypothetical protein